jgi:hypothetical protein
MATPVIRSSLAAIFLLPVFIGCISDVRLPYRPVPVAFDNPVSIPIANYQLVWDGVEQIVKDNFRIDRDDPVRLIGNTLYPGRIDTFPMPGATILEPWYHDSANDYERLESTLQSIRRYAVVKVIPAQNGGFWVDVAVFKELENLRQPEHSTAGSATFRNDASLSPRIKPDQVLSINQKWIPQGRDTAAEQRIIGQILDRFTPAGTPVPLN